MRCPSCQHEMKESRGPHLYMESGLDNVILEDVPIYTCACGEEMVSFHRVPTLNSAIGEELIKKNTPLSGREIRFLRKNMGFSSTRFAETMGVDKSSVSRWENGTQKLSATNDRMIRIIYCAMKDLGGRKLVEETFPDISSEAPKNEKGIQHHFALTHNRWEEVHR